MNAIPEKWYVLYRDKREFDIINNHFKLHWNYNSRKDCGCSNHEESIWVGGINTKETLDKQEFKQISFEDFEKYIVNKKPFTIKGNLKYLKLLLKKLNIK